MSDETPWQIFEWRKATFSVELPLYCAVLTSAAGHGRPQKSLQGGGKVEILLIFFSLLAMQREWTYTKRKMSNVTQQLHTMFSL